MGMDIDIDKDTDTDLEMDADTNHDYYFFRCPLALFRSSEERLPLPLFRYFDRFGSALLLDRYSASAILTVVRYSEKTTIPSEQHSIKVRVSTEFCRKGIPPEFRTLVGIDIKFRGIPRNSEIGFHGIPRYFMYGISNFYAYLESYMYK
jgi:hypothetical protein